MREIARRVLQDSTYRPRARIVGTIIAEHGLATVSREDVAAWLPGDGIIKARPVLDELHERGVIDFGWEATEWRVELTFQQRGEVRLGDHPMTDREWRVLTDVWLDLPAPCWFFGHPGG